MRNAQQQWKVIADAKSMKGIERSMKHWAKQIGFDGDLPEFEDRSAALYWIESTGADTLGEQFSRPSDDEVKPLKQMVKKETKVEVLETTEMADAILVQSNEDPYIPPNWDRMSKDEQTVFCAANWPESLWPEKAQIDEAIERLSKTLSV